MTYAVFPTSNATLLFAAKLHEQGCTVVVGESTPSERFNGVLEKYPADKLRTALAKLKDKSAYTLILDQAEPIEGFNALTIQPSPFDDGLVHLFRDGERVLSALEITNDSLGAGNTGPVAGRAQTLVIGVSPAIPKVEQPGLVLYGSPWGLFSVSALVGSEVDIFDPEASADAYGAIVGLFEAPDFLTEPRDVSCGCGETISEAVDEAYEGIDPQKLYRPAFDFLSLAYESSIPNRYNAGAETLGLERFDEEPERERLLAKQQAELKEQREAVDRELKQERENYATSLERIKAENDAAVAGIKAEVEQILHDSDHTTTR